MAIKVQYPNIPISKIIQNMWHWKWFGMVMFVLVFILLMLIMPRQELQKAAWSELTVEIGQISWIPLPDSLGPSSITLPTEMMKKTPLEEPQYIEDRLLKIFPGKQITATTNPDRVKIKSFADTIESSKKEVFIIAEKIISYHDLLWKRYQKIIEMNIHHQREYEKMIEDQITYLEKVQKRPVVVYQNINDKESTKKLHSLPKYIVDEKIRRENRLINSRLISNIALEGVRITKTAILEGSLNSNSASVKKKYYNFYRIGIVSLVLAFFTIFLLAFFETLRNK